MDWIYLAIFVTSIAIAFAEYLKDVSNINLAILILSVFGAAFSIKDLSDTSNKINYLTRLARINDSIQKNIDTLSKLNYTLSTNINAAVAAEGVLAGKTYSVTDRIAKMDDEIQKISLNTNSISQELRIFTTNGNARLVIGVDFSYSSAGIFANFSITRYGMYLVPSVFVTISNGQKSIDYLHRHPNMEHLEDSSQIRYTIHNLSDPQAIDTFKLRPFDKYPTQEFFFTIITPFSFHWQEMYMRLMPDNTVNFAYYIEDRYSHKTLDSFLDKSFLLKGEHTFEDVRHTYAVQNP